MKRPQSIVALGGILAVLAWASSACLTLEAPFPCAMDGKCPFNLDCIAGTCTARPTCGASPTSVEHDEENCGACGSVCPPEHRCVRGRCACPETLPDLCLDECVNLADDSEHCGSCDSRCAVGERCFVGGCACPEEHQCDGGCADLEHDIANCGACGRQCPVGSTCEEGNCHYCPTGSGLCNGSCTRLDTLTDCGACGRACPRPGSCIGSPAECTCPNGMAFCDGACINILEDDRNCGGCALLCPSGCENGRCLVELGPGQNAIGDLAVHDGNLFWISAGGLFQMGADGGTPALTAQSVSRFAVSGQDIFAVKRVSTNFAQIVKMPLTGGPATVLASSESAFVNAIVADTAAGSTFWADGNEIRAANFGGGGLRVVVPRVNALFLESAYGSLYWAERNGAVRKYSGALAPETVTMNDTGKTTTAFSIAVGKVFFSTGDRILCATLPAGAATLLLAPSAGHAPTDLATDQKNVYWVEPDTGRVAKMPLSGGAVTVLSQPMTRPVSIAVDTTSVYWMTSQNGGAIWKMTPK